MKKDELFNALKSIEAHEEEINNAIGENLNLKNVCNASLRSLKAWGMVLREFNDVITTLEDSKEETDQAYCAAFKQAMHIVMYVNKYRRID